MLTKIDDTVPWITALFRVIIGFLLFCHGASTLFAWPVAPHGGATAAVGAWPSWWAGAIQLIAGAALVLGLGTRIAALVASGAMAVAYFWKHQPDALLPIANDGDAAALFAWSLLLLVFLGAGRVSVDAALRRRRTGVVAAECETASVETASV